MLRAVRPSDSAISGCCGPPRRAHRQASGATDCCPDAALQQRAVGRNLIFGRANGLTGRILQDNVRLKQIAALRHRLDIRGIGRYLLAGEQSGGLRVHVQIGSQAVNNFADVGYGVSLR